MKTIEEKLKELNEELTTIAPNVSKPMRMKWALENDCSLTTVDRYLNGQAKMTVFASKLLSDLKKTLSTVEP